MRLLGCYRKPDAWPGAVSTHRPGLGPGLCCLMPVLGRLQPVSWRAWELHSVSDSKRSSRMVLQKPTRWLHAGEVGRVLVPVLGSRASKSHPYLSTQGVVLTPKALAQAARPRDKNSSLGLPEESKSWLQTRGPAFMTGFYFMPWGASGWAEGQSCWAPPMLTGSITAFLLSVWHTGSLPKIWLEFFGNHSPHWKKYIICGGVFLNFEIKLFFLIIKVIST